MIEEKAPKCPKCLVPMVPHYDNVGYDIPGGHLEIDFYACPRCGMKDEEIDEE
jgi:ribosomal protein S27AE